MLRRLKNRRFDIPAALLALALGWLWAGGGPGLRLEGLVFDRAAPLLGNPRSAPGLVVILIDEQDYTKAATPLALWGMNLASLFDLLARSGPRAVGLDLILPRFPLGKFVRAHDSLLMRSLKNLSQKTRLVSGYGIAPDGRTLGPFRTYRRILGPDGYGYFNLSPDLDGVCRSLIISRAGAGKSDLHAFAALLAGRKARPGTVFTPDWRNPARIQTLSFGQALEANPSAFGGKLVLIGVDFEFEDRHPNPAARGAEPGVLFQARVAEGLMTGRALVDPGRLVSTLAPALALLLILFFSPPASSPLRALGLGSALLVLLAGVYLAALAGGVIIRPVAGAGAVIAFSLLRLMRGYLFTREVFGRYVEPAVRDEILSGRVPLDGETKEATLLFCDLRGFTPLVESTPPKEVIRILNGYYKEMAEAIRTNKGLVMQYVGDEVYAAFGAPLADPDQADSALRAGLEMRRRLARYNRRLEERGRPPLEHGIGIHTGTVLAANIGGGDRLSYALVGDPVNLASRIQGLNKEFGTAMIISRATEERLKERRGFALRPLPPTRVKGRSEPVELFQVIPEGEEEGVQAGTGGTPNEK